MFSSMRKALCGMLVGAALLNIAPVYSAPANGGVTAQQLDQAAVARYLARMPKGVQTVVDMTDPVTEAAVMAQHRLAGRTPKSDADLYKDLAQYKQRQLEMKKQGVAITVRSMLTAAGVPEDEPQPYVQMQGFRGTDQVGYDVIATAYVPDGEPLNGGASRRLKVMLSMLDANGRSLVRPVTLDSNSMPDANLRAMPGASNKTETKPTGETRAQSQMMYYHDGALAVVADANWGEAAIAIVTARQLTDPRHTVTPDKRAEESIIVCLNRANGSGICDYGPTQRGLSRDQLHIVFPISGKLTYNLPIIVYGDGTGDSSPVIEVALGGEKGGTCLALLTPDKASVENGITFLPDGKGFTWDFPTADFGKTCYASGTKLPFNVTVTSLVDDGSPGGSLLTAAWASDFTLSGGVIAKNYEQISRIEIQYGCVLEGTMVRLADGSRSEAPIEQIKAGDIIAGKNGERLRVRTVMNGTDTDFVRIVAADNTVMLTPDHPVPTGRGMIAASDVRVGDRVYDKTGAALSVREASKQRMDTVRNVYNLVLEKTGGGDIVNPEDAVFLAGGIQVGDNAMQGLLIKQRSGTGQ